MMIDEPTGVKARQRRRVRKPVAVVAVTRNGGHLMTTGVRRVELEPEGMLRLEWNERLSPLRVRLLSRAGVRIEPRRTAGVVEIAYYQVRKTMSARRRQAVNLVSRASRQRRR